MDNAAIEYNTLLGYALVLNNFRNDGDDSIIFGLSLLDEDEFEYFEKIFKKKRRSKKSGIFDDELFLMRRRGDRKISSKVPNTKLRNTFKYIELAADISESSETRLTQFYDSIRDVIEKKYQGRKVLPKIQKLSRIFGLDKNESDILMFKYMASMNHLLSNAVDNARLSHNQYEAEHIFLQHVLDITMKEILKYLNSGGALEKNELLNCGEIGENVKGFLLDECQESFLSYLCQKSRGKIFPLESFSVDKHIAETAAAIMSNVDNARILIYGASGAGKTEFAKSLARHCGLQSYFVEEPKNIYMAAAALTGGKEIVIADEADDMLSEGNSIFRDNIKKGDINIKMDSMNGQCIFICNDISNIDASVLRRFHLIMEFKELTASKRAEMWTENIKPLTKFIDKDEVINYAKKYSLSLGIASQSADAAVKCGQSKQEQLEYFEKLMDSHNKLCNGEVKKVKTNPKFSVDFLNTCTDINLILNYSKKCAEKMTTGDGVRCSMLFHGAPGTGKTEFAKFITEYLGIEPYVVNISDIKSMWVGGTEKNIRNSFRRAEERGEMLIFDEVDSMLYNRTTARVSWERDEVNEFLSMMDTYKGFLACTTNYLATLDAACLRRFSWKVEFRPLSRHQLMKAVSYYFPDIDFSVCESEIQALENIAAGDIAVVAANTLHETESAKEIITLLGNEAKYKKQYNKDKIGF